MRKQLDHVSVSYLGRPDVRCRDEAEALALVRKYCPRGDAQIDPWSPLKVEPNTGRDPIAWDAAKWRRAPQGPDRYCGKIVRVYVVLYGGE